MITSRAAYTIGITVADDQETAIERVTAALAEEGFGVLTTIDVAATLKKKIDVDREPYVILGACNPNLANRGLQVEPELGALLPCNVIVYQHDGETRISAMEPEGALGIVGNEDLSPVATEAKERLTRALNSLL